jgi:hypothetical protein
VIASAFASVAPVLAQSAPEVCSRICLQRVRAYPPGDSDLWDHGLMWTGQPNRCAEHAFGKAAPAGEVPLDNDLSEFSLA